MKTRDQFRRFDVDWILIPERSALHANDESELFDVVRQIGEPEAGEFAFVAI